MLLNLVTLQRAFGDGRVATLCTIMRVLLGVSAYVDVIVDFVPEQFTTVLTFQVSVNFPEPLERLHVESNLLKR